MEDVYNHSASPLSAEIDAFITALAANARYENQAPPLLGDPEVGFQILHVISETTENYIAMDELCDRAYALYEPLRKTDNGARHDLRYLLEKTIEAVKERHGATEALKIGRQFIRPEAINSMTKGLREFCDRLEKEIPQQSNAAQPETALAAHAN